MNDQIEIDLKDMLGRLLQKWKKIVIVTVCTTVSGGAYGMYQKSQLQSASEIREAELASAKDALSEEQLSTVESIYSQYLTALSDQEAILENQKNSLLAKLDYSSTSTTTRQYVVTTSVTNLSSSWSSLLSEEEKEQIVAILGNELDTAHVYELYSITISNNNLSYIVDSETTAYPSTIVQVVTIGSSEETSEAIADIIEDALFEQFDSLTAGGYATTYQFVSSSTSTGINDTVKTYQTKITTDLSNATTKITNLQSSNLLDTDEKTYYSLLITRAEEAEGSVNIKKLVIAGFGGGLILMIFIYALLYVIGGKLKTMNEVSSGYGIPVLAGIVNDENKKKKLSGKLLSKPNYDNAYEMQSLALELRNFMKKNNLTEVFIADMNVDEKTTQAFYDRLKDVKIVHGDPTKDATVLEKVTEKGHVFLLTETYHTSYSAMNDFVEFCKRQNVEIPGAVVAVEL